MFVGRSERGQTDCWSWGAPCNGIIRYGSNDLSYRMNPNMIFIADPKLRAGDRNDLSMGMNFYVPHGKLKSYRLAVEAFWPIYQSLVGPQLEQDWSLVAGWQYTW